jgi:hypothetical protein
MFRHRRHLRHWAARVLLLWLFGIGAGIANACLVPDTGGAQHEISAPGVAEHHAVPSGQTGAATQSNCGDFCDKASVSIPALKSALDPVHGQAILMSPVAVVLSVPALAPVPVQRHRRVALRPPPIHIAFLRLAL